MVDDCTEEEAMPPPYQDESDNFSMGEVKRRGEGERNQFSGLTGDDADRALCMQKTTH